MGGRDCIEWDCIGQCKNYRSGLHLAILGYLDDCRLNVNILQPKLIQFFSVNGGIMQDYKIVKLRYDNVIMLYLYIDINHL